MDALASSIDRLSAGEAAALAASIPVTETITSGADTVDVHLDWIRTELPSAATSNQWPARRAALAARLRAMRREAATPSAGTRPAGADEALHRVIAARGFRNARTATWQAGLLRRMKEWVADLWLRTLGRRVGQRTIAVVLAWAASIAAIAVLLIWLTRLAVRRRAEQPLDLGAVTARRAAARELALEATALARAGR